MDKRVLKKANMIILLAISSIGCKSLNTAFRHRKIYGGKIIGENISQHKNVYVNRINICDLY